MATARPTLTGEEYVSQVQLAERLNEANAAAVAVDSKADAGHTHAGGGGGGGTPDAHAASHASGGSDPVTPASIGAPETADVLLLSSTTTLGRSVVNAADEAAARTAISAASNVHTHDYSELTGTPTLTDASSLVSGQLAVDRQPPGYNMVIDYYKTDYGAANAWPASRPTARGDIYITWRGPAPAPLSIMLAGDDFDAVG